MLLDDKKNIAQNPYRRPYACGALEVSSLLQAKEDQDRIIHEEDLNNSSFIMPLYLWYAVDLPLFVMTFAYRVVCRMVRQRWAMSG